VRLLHTSDWHVGRSFHGAPLLEHQVTVLQAIVDVVRSEAVDLVVVAGDLYDRQLPPADAVDVMSWAVCELRGAGAHVVAIAGNHDSAARVGFAEQVLTAAGVTIRGDAGRCGEPVIVAAGADEAPVAVYPIPYLDPELARHPLGVPGARTHQAVLDVALDRARTELSARAGTRSVAVVHAFVAGGESCESERALAVGSSAEVGLRSMRGFDYVALGHLHRRQSLGDGRVRYAGSPLAYSFSERAHTKGVWLVDLEVGGTVHATEVDLPVPRPLAAITGTLDELLRASHHTGAEDAWVHATITDTQLPPEAMVRLRARFPHAALLVHQPPAGPDRPELSYTERLRDRSDLELMLDFVEHVTGEPAGPAEEADLVTAFAGVEGER